jgi:hypothetical protein
MYIYVTITGPLPRVGYFGPISEEIGVNVPDKSQESFEAAHEQAIELFCECHKCKENQVRIVGAFDGKF